MSDGHDPDAPAVPEARPPAPPTWTWSAEPPRPDPYGGAPPDVPVSEPVPLGPEATASTRSVFALGPEDDDENPPGMPLAGPGYAPIDPIEGRDRGHEEDPPPAGARWSGVAGAVAAALLLLGGLVAALVLPGGGEDDESAGSASASASARRTTSTTVPTTTTTTAPPTTTTTAPPTTTTTEPPTTTTTTAPPTTTTTAPPTTTTTPPPPPTPPPVYYDDCWQAWQAGAAPIAQGEPGYRPELDYDGDGVACEPQWGRGR